MTKLPSDWKKLFCFSTGPCNNTISYMTQHLHTTLTWTGDETARGRVLALYQYIISCPVPLSDRIHTQHSSAREYTITQRLSFGHNWWVEAATSPNPLLKVRERERERDVNNQQLKFTDSDKPVRFMYFSPAKGFSEHQYYVSQMFVHPFEYIC